ncbi:quinone oxidoreductase family protein [Streptomyces sp. NPDC001393]
MRALVLTGPSMTADRTEICQVEEPQPKAGEISIDVAYAGINFKDLMQRRGDPEWVSSWPVTPGMEVSGRVRRVGDGVSGLVPGQRVTAFVGQGGLAEVATARVDLTVPVPDGVGLRVAAAVPIVLTTGVLLLADSARVVPGETVLVHSAAGGVGTAIARLAPLYGVARLIGTVSSAGRADSLRDAGYDAIVARDESLGDAVREVAPAGVDVVLNPLGPGAIEDDLAVTAVGGRIVLFGNAAGGTQDLPPFYRLIAANVALCGMGISGLTAKAPDRVTAAMRRVLELLDSGDLTYPVTEVPLAEVPGVHQAMADRRAVGKFVARL